MNIYELSPFLEKGKKLKRLCWEQDSYIINQLDYIQFHYKNKMFFHFTEDKKHELINTIIKENWEPTLEDLMANDWEVI